MHIGKVQNNSVFGKHRSQFHYTCKKKKTSKESAYKTHKYTHQRCQTFIVNNPVFLFSQPLYICKTEQEGEGERGRWYSFSLLKTPWTWKDKPQTLGLQWLGIQANSTKSFKAFSIFKWLRMELIHGMLVTPHREAYLWYMARIAWSSSFTGKLKIKGILWRLWVCFYFVNF